ncbi:NTP transferase domain-containing protein [Phocaeicola vulgatus]|nr:NTP transferase domain-containing protein [Phocaeicola vulgatus]
MQIILLSGGSGKRLWPLSNNTRSKQFIKLLTAPDGSKESMVQRVVRQLRETGICDSITVATSQSQRDIIINQLGEEIPVVTEPERRDTFPAIALASSYLAYKRKCSTDEIIIVMPCDPYTETGYFETIRRIADAVKNNVAELVLMGINPTYPSAKYGYVVPVNDVQNKGIFQVSRFTEKPDMITAEKLISEGAFWNGGVFAFRLGYMTDIVTRHIKTDTFSEIRSRYGEFPKIIIRKTKRCDFPERSVRFCKTKCILGSTPTLLLISQNRPAYAGNVKRRLNTIQTPFALRFVASLPPMLSR